MREGRAGAEVRAGPLMFERIIVKDRCGKNTVNSGGLQQ